MKHCPSVEARGCVEATPMTTDSANVWHRESCSAMPVISGSRILSSLELCRVPPAQRKGDSQEIPKEIAIVVVRKPSHVHESKRAQVRE